MSEIASLRSRLRAVNMQYSALLRTNAGEARPFRLAKLRAERQVLMSLISVHSRSEAKQRPLHHALSMPPRSAAAGAVRSL